MENYKGTPAPWVVINGWDNNGEGHLFPSVVLHQGCGDVNRRKITINVSHDQEKESLMANAYVISCAPELLEELQGALTMFKEYLLTRGEIGKMQVDRWEYLINKALGKNN